ncbi:hypothetical protein F5887DRAFT_1268551 [Amanita rubescens]|nr:hypothetical protein F5887DRAFT_1268551 [Amanita rubescens]
MALNALHIHSHKTQLILAAITASLATATLITAYSTYTRRVNRKALGEEVSKALAKAAADEGLPNFTSDTQNTDYDESLIREQLARNYSFFGEEAMAKIRKGFRRRSWAAVMLVRSGVSKIRLVDFDYVTLSSLNRHATAGLNDVGTPKVICEDGDLLLEGADWVVDAIDNIQSKVDLLKCCHDHGIKVFSSMGAGAKCDPTRIQISDISDTIYDPLARSVRVRLRQLGVSSGIPVVYSTEVPGDVKLLPLPEEEFQKGNVKELGVFDDFRVRILPVFGPLPAIFGLNIASYVCCELGGKPIPNPFGLLRDLLVRESKFTGLPLNKLPIDEDDVALILEDVHLGKSVLPPHDYDWDASRPLTIENCVVMDSKDCRKNIGSPIRDPSGTFVDPKEIWGTQVQEIVTRRAKELERQRQWVMP